MPTNIEEQDIYTVCEFQRGDFRPGLYNKILVSPYGLNNILYL